MEVSKLKGKGKEQTLVPFNDLLSSLELSHSSALPKHLAAALEGQLSALQAPHNPFPRSAAALAQLKKSLSAEQLALAEQVADRFDCDEERCWKGVQLVRKDEKATTLSDEEWDALTACMFEERMAVMATLALLLRCRDDEAHPCHGLAHSLLPSILTPTFVSAILQSFQQRTTTLLPSQIRTSSAHTLFWTSQLILEQKALLEILFLVLYSAPLPASDYVVLLDVVDKTEFGTRQELFGYFDERCRELVQELAALLTVLLVEALDLESLIDASNLAFDNGNAIFHPSQLPQIIPKVESVAAQDRHRSSPLLLAFAFTLSRVSTSASQPLSPATQELLHLLPTQQTPLYQLYASHALSPSSQLFPSLLSILSLPSISSPNNPNTLGYFSVLRTLLVALPLLVKLPFLPEDEYLGLVQVFAKVHAQKGLEDLVRSVWASEEAGEGEEILQLAKARFPVQLSPLLSIVQSLVPLSTSEEEAEAAEEAARECAVAASRFFGALTSLTHAVPGSSQAALLPYELLALPEDEAEEGVVWYRATRPIQISKRVVVPRDTRGRLVSQRGRKPLVIAWELEWSAWSLLQDVLELYARPASSRAVGDVFGASSFNQLPFTFSSDEEQDSTLTSILDLFRRVVFTDPLLARRLIEHVELPAPAANFIETLFQILHRAWSRSSLSVVSAVIHLISALLPAFAGSIFTHLRASALLFTPSSPSTIPLFRAEALGSTYPVTSSLISLAHALVLEDQISQYAVSPSFADLKRSVVLRSLSWLRTEIWTESRSRKVVSAEEKWKLEKAVVDVWGLVLEQAELTPESSESGKAVLEHLVGAQTNMASLAPIVATLSAGPGMIQHLRKALRYADAQALEDVVFAELRLVRKLLRFRRRTSGGEGAGATKPSLLERLCFAATTGSRKMEGEGSGLFLSIARFIVAPVAAQTAIEATKVITLLCLSTAGLKASTQISLGALLGGTTERIQGFVKALLGVVEDIQGDDDLVVAVWDLISAIVETQPGLAILLVTGRHYPFSADLSKSPAASEGTTSDEQALQLAKSRSLAPPSLDPLPRTALGIGLETVGTWTESWTSHPAVLAAVLRFFDFVFQHLVDYGSALDSFRQRAEAWDAFTKIAFEPVGEGEDVRVSCQRLMAKSHAVRILALDLQLEGSKKGGGSKASSKELLKTLENKAKLKEAMAVAISTSCAPMLHEGVLGLLQESFPEVPLEELRLPAPSHPLDDAREFGVGYLYSLPLLRRKLDGFMADPESTIDRAALDDVVDHTASLNVNFSLLEAEISNTRSWRQLLEIALPLIKRDSAAASAMASVGASLVGGEIAAENRTSQIIATVHEERLSILLTMVEALESVATPPKEDLVELFLDLSKIFSSETLAPLESIARRIKPAFHRTLLRIAYFAYRKLGTVERSTFDAAQQVALAQATEVTFRILLTATRDLLVFARASKDADVEQDLALAVGVIGQVVRSSFVPPASVWLVHCRSIDLFRSAFDVFVYMTQLDGRTLNAQHVLDLCLALAGSSPQAAEYMALDGLMTALTNNALSAAAEAGSITVTNPDGERSAQHALWTSMLGLVVSLTSSLGGSTQFVEQEVTGFVRLYSAQLAVVMRWDSDSVLTLPLVEEMLNTASLIYGVVRQTGVNPAVLSALAEQAAYLLQQVVFVLLHPNHLIGLIEPVTSEERVHLDKEEERATQERDAKRAKLGESSKRGATEREGSADLAERPIAAMVTLSLVRLARVLVDSLLVYTQAFAILTQDSADWKTDKAIILPSATVTSSEKASVGTLFDLVDWCLDTLRHPSSTNVQPSSLLTNLPAYSTEALRLDAEQTLEGAVILAATQLGAWLVRPEQNPTRAQGVMRREIKTELAGELLTKVGKSEKPTAGAASSGGQGLAPELAEVLHSFIVTKLKE